MKSAWSKVEDYWRDCDACPNLKSPLKVLGEGPPDAQVLLVGEAPGATELVKIRPFVGESGQILRTLLGPALDRTYITNTVVCHPPGNRTPTPDETARCFGRLVDLAAMLQPRLIVAVGNTARDVVMPSASVRGKWTGSEVLREEIVAAMRCTPLAFYVHHPAYILRRGGISSSANQAIVAMYAELRELMIMVSTDEHA